MEHSLDVIKRISEQKGVVPVEMLANLLEVLRTNHLMYSVGSFARGTVNRSNVVNEIQNLMQLNAAAEIPQSVLATVDLALRMNHALDVANSNNPKAPTEKSAPLARRATSIEALRLIIRELINAAEQRGIESTLRLEEMAKQEGWTLNPPPHPDDVDDNESGPKA